MEHTELPWVYDEKLKFNFYSDDATGSIIGTVDGFQLAPRSAEEKEANAAFIVKACNNHYSILNALYQARLQIEYLNEKYQETGSGNAVLAVIEQVIAKVDSPT